MTWWETILATVQMPLGVALVSLTLTWFVGSRVSAYWTGRQKRNELDSAAATELYELYGEFVAIWKLWNRTDAVGSAETREARRVDLLERATRMEGRFEALLLALTSRFVWSPRELDDLGLMRQLFQFPREQIESSASDSQDLRIPWHYSEHPQYREFKRVCTSVGIRLTGGSGLARFLRFRAVQKASSQFAYVTANLPHEDNCDKLADEGARSPNQMQRTAPARAMERRR